LVPLTYLAVILYISGNLEPGTVTGFITGDAQRNASFGLTGQGLFLSAANFVRSFIQIHGYMFNMFRSNVLLMIPAIISIGFFFFSFFALSTIKQDKKELKFSGILILIIV
jgi:hypothetical protein